MTTLHTLTQSSDSMDAQTMGVATSASFDLSSDLLLTVEETAKRLRCGRTTVYALIKSGDLRSVRVGALRRIRPVDLESYVSQLKPEPAEAA